MSKLRSVSNTISAHFRPFTFCSVFLIETFTVIIEHYSTFCRKPGAFRAEKHFRLCTCVLIILLFAVPLSILAVYFCKPALLPYRFALNQKVSRETKTPDAVTRPVFFICGTLSVTAYFFIFCNVTPHGGDVAVQFPLTKLFSLQSPFSIFNPYFFSNSVTILIILLSRNANAFSQIIEGMP